MISEKKNAQLLIAACKAYGVSDIIISPGSRNAPLTISFAEDSFFNVKVVVDERSAAFVALGIAQQKKKPALITCTSGSATLNYAPAIAEAYYQNIPLIIASADRPEEWIGQGEGQCINQQNVFQNYCDCNNHLNISDDEKSIQDNKSKILNAFDYVFNFSKPAHINLPFDEPLYNTIDQNPIEITKSEKTINEHPLEISPFAETFNSSAKVIILCGQMPPNPKLLHQLSEINRLYAVTVLTESTSNLYHPKFIGCIDRTLATINEDEIEKYQPDLLITLGGEIISKKIKHFLRKTKLKEHWHIHPTDSKDTFKQLSHFIPTRPSKFFKLLNEKAIENYDSNFGNLWYAKSIHGQDKHLEYIKSCDWSDLKAVASLIDYLPDSINFHLGNSSAVRYVQLFDGIKNVSYYGNRGVSGIDGSTSTALGFSLHSNELNVLLSGDLSFVYDSNALWTKWPKNFKAIVMNNNGGGIFRIIDGPNSTNQIDDFFEVGNTVDIQHLAQSFGIKSIRVYTEKELNNAIKTFFDIDNPIQLLEIITPNLDNPQILKQYFEFLK